jgi:hypothetical protein
VRPRTVVFVSVVILGAGAVLRVFAGVNADWVMASIWTWLSLCIVLAGFGRCTDEMLDRWSLRYDVAIDHPRREWIRARLRRARRARWVAFGLGTLVASTPMYLDVIAPERAAGIAEALRGTNAPWVAAALSTLLVELFVVQRPRGARVAALERRRWGDYVGERWRVMLVALAIVATVAAAMRIVDRSPDPSSDRGVAAISATWAVAALVLALVGMRAIVDRPLLAVEGMDRRLDEALRADAAHHLIGAAVAMSVLGAASVLIEVMPTSPLEVVVGLGTWFGVGCWWFLSRQETWNVARVRWSRA